MARIKELEDFTCRSFNPDEVMQMLVPDDERFESYLDWNVNENIAVVNSIDGNIGGLLMKLEHKNYNDCVYITLSFLDYFNVYFIGHELKVLRTIENVPCDALFDTINEQLENYIPFQFSLN